MFLIPNFGFTWQLDDKSSFAVALAGQGGMNTEYPTATFRNFAFPANTTLPDNPRNLNPNGQFNASKPTGVDLIQVGIGLTYARQLTERHALGITPIFAIQRFKAEGLQPFTQVGPDGQALFSVSPDNVTNNGFELFFRRRGTGRLARHGGERP